MGSQHIFEISGVRNSGKQEFINKKIRGQKWLRWGL